MASCARLNWLWWRGGRGVRSGRAALMALQAVFQQAGPRLQLALNLITHLCHPGWLTTVACWPAARLTGTQGGSPFYKWLSSFRYPTRGTRAVLGVWGQSLCSVSDPTPTFALLWTHITCKSSCELGSLFDVRREFFTSFLTLSLSVSPLRLASLDPISSKVVVNGYCPQDFATFPTSRLLPVATSEREPQSKKLTGSGGKPVTNKQTNNNKMTSSKQKRSQ